MLAELGSLVPHPKAFRLPAWCRSTAKVLAIPVSGLFLCRPHRLLPSTVPVASTSFGLASAMFFGAAVLRHSVVGGQALESVLLATVFSYGVLFLVSVADRLAELVLCLCICAGIDMVASCLALPGLKALNGASAQSFLFIWQLAAIFIALVQLRISRQSSDLQ